MSYVRRTGMPRVTLVVVTNATPGLVHLYLPCHQFVCLVTLPCVTSRCFHVSTNCAYHVKFHVALYRLYGLYNHHFFPVWPNEHITIFGAYDLHLSPFKLRWFHINEAYVHVFVESILINFIFKPF
jgi:hypothetical protein